MEISFAPLDGITGYIFRKVHNDFFPGAERYWAPFIAPDSTGTFKAGSLRDVLPENNGDITPVPQLLANNPLAFLSAAEELAAMGYEEVNLNAGCPSGTVTAKHKGAGMLADPASLDSFLDAVFARCPIKVSVKTRLGMESGEEFGELLEIYKKYPMSQLVVHTRVRSGMYKAPADMAAFAPALETFGGRACYNGSICGTDSYNGLVKTYPALNALMVGRGAAANPALIRVLKGGAPAERKEMKAFHDTLLARTLESGLFEQFAVNRMKELWWYMICLFPGSEKQYKAICKAKHLTDYVSAVNALFTAGAFDGGAAFRG